MHLCAAGILLLSALACKKQELLKEPTEMTLAQKISRFVPTTVTADRSSLKPNDVQALRKIIEASRLMDEIYLRQVWQKNPGLLKQLKADTSETGKERLDYFRINMGPWSRLDGDSAFIDGVPVQQPAQANYYPDDMTKEEFNRWISTLDESKKEKAAGFFTVIRRDAQKNLTIVPYNEEYRLWLVPAAKLLNEAAALTSSRSLKKYLRARAAAFLSNDYYASDIAWMELDAPIEVTIGPYETYMDGLFNYKAAFESFVALRDKAADKQLRKFSAALQEIENNLPIDPAQRNPKLAALSPIRVVDVLYASGEGNCGVQTAAFNLPNDERVVYEKGSKRVMLKNVQEAKFTNILVPISKIVLDSTQKKFVSFDAFFTHILAHELMHGLGPHNITAGGKATTVRKELKELHSPLEEAKADITGLFALQYLIDKGVLDKKLEREMYATYLASMFRSVRFGISEAHAKGVAIQFNYLTLEGAINIDEMDGTFSIDPDKAKEAVKKLTGEILTLQAEGSYTKGLAMIGRFAIIHPAMQRALNKMSGIPVDIRPQYTAVRTPAGALR
jgi:hypothetical protein